MHIASCIKPEFLGNTFFDIKDIPYIGKVFSYQIWRWLHWRTLYQSCGSNLSWNKGTQKETEYFIKAHDN